MAIVGICIGAVSIAIGSDWAIIFPLDKTTAINFLPAIKLSELVTVML